MENVIERHVPWFEQRGYLSAQKETLYDFEINSR
jgi:hypothetical protein